MNEIFQVITLTDVWVFLPCPLFFFFFLLEEREVPSTQRSKWNFRRRSSWDCGWAWNWLQGPVEDWRCSDGSALWRWPGRICYCPWRPSDAHSQRHDIYSSCSHSRSLVNSLSAAAFCRWEAYLHICPTEQLVFLSVMKSSVCCLHLYTVCLQRTFSLLLHSHGSVWIHYDRPKSWNLDHISPVTTSSAVAYVQGRVWTDGQFSLRSVFLSEWQELLSLNSEITYMFSKQVKKTHPTSKYLTFASMTIPRTFSLTACGSTGDIFSYLFSQRC